MKAYACTALLLVIFALSFQPAAIGQGVPPGGLNPGTEGEGSLPAEATQVEYPGAGKVRPGNCGTNGDDVTVCNDEGSGGNASLDPREDQGQEGDETTVRTDTGFDGDIEGMDSNDTAYLGSSNSASVSGTGGVVSVSGGSSVTVTNTGTQPGNQTTVILPSGNTVTVPGGSTVTINT